MVTLESIIPSMEKDTWFVALNIEVAYFHVDIHLSHRMFLTFLVGQEHYLLRVLPFGLAASPQAFIKEVSVVAAQMR